MTAELYTSDGDIRELGGTTASIESRAVYIRQPTVRTQRSELASKAELYTSDGDQHELDGTSASCESRAVYVGQSTARTQRGRLASETELYTWNGYQREFGGTRQPSCIRQMATCADSAGQPPASKAELYISGSQQRELSGAS